MSTSSAASTVADNHPAHGRVTARRGHRLAVIPRYSLVPCLLLIGNLAQAAVAMPGGGCMPQDTEAVSIRHVHDGDTVVRSDGERIRLIGIDTPELARDGRPAENYALAARDHLRALIAEADNLSARYGPERRDDYGRLLAHLYADGRNLQAELLEAGLATPLFIAPNLGHADCYRQATGMARDARRGIWQLPQYRPRAAASLSGNERGYHIVTGAVQRVGRSRCCIWLNLDDDFALRIEHEHLALFEDIDFNRLEGQRLEARGYIYRRNDQLRMHLRHPADLVIRD